MLGFRVWDKKNNNFVELNNLFINKSAELYGLHLIDGLFEIGTNDRFIPMQSTGLKDCSDKEIYEGDILSVSDAMLEAIIFVESIPDFYGRISGGQHGLNLVVIGNKYENPELMEKI